ncbi:hypothetical protein ORI98_10210 [Shewanella sp. ULN5]|uniref:hypothetical protein n=1 Tax=Shewanella sp. ULN5 TaxID=2994678 RepID=UPI002740191E|nr:hypothetical protein [Shewanella sp. ULN5]MDP5146810.1 hypothetical protein [Shewanella sp. ULN5]
MKINKAKTHPGAIFYNIMLFNYYLNYDSMHAADKAMADLLPRKSMINLIISGL